MFPLHLWLPKAHVEALLPAVSISRYIIEVRVIWLYTIFFVPISKGFLLFFTTYLSVAILSIFLAYLRFCGRMIKTDYRLFLYSHMNYLVGAIFVRI